MKRSRLSRPQSQIFYRSKCSVNVNDCEFDIEADFSLKLQKHRFTKDLNASIEGLKASTVATSQRSFPPFRASGSQKNLANQEEKSSY